MRGFEKVTYIEAGVIPKRGTSKSAGYDFSTIEEIEIKPNSVILIKTGIKSYMMSDEVLQVYVRSSVGFKKNLMLANTVGIIDSDYYNNENNEGHIMIALYNYGKETQFLEKGERIAQGVFSKYLVADNDDNQIQRSGGYGSTN